MSYLRKSTAILVCLLVLLPSLAAESGGDELPLYEALEFLDRELISLNQVMIVTRTISRSAPDLEGDATPRGSCLFESFEFDRRGNLVRYSPPLVASDFYYSYSEDNQLIDFGWIESDGNTISLKDTLRRSGYTNEVVKTYKAARIDGTASLTRAVSSACFNIDASYRFMHKIGEDGLPESGVAEKVRENESGMFSTVSGFQSPQNLYVQYTYKRWGDL